jgi:hypothetical protein
MRSIIILPFDRPNPVERAISNGSGMIGARLRAQGTSLDQESFRIQEKEGKGFQVRDALDKYRQN